MVSNIFCGFSVFYLMCNAKDLGSIIEEDVKGNLPPSVRKNHLHSVIGCVISTF